LLLGRHSAVKALVITHYFGFPQEHLAQLVQLCEKHSVALIEDCAHALFSSEGDEALGRFGRFAIFSPRKSLPLTEGGLMVKNCAKADAAVVSLASPDWLPRWQRLIYSMLQNLRSAERDAAAWQRFSRISCMVLLSIPAVVIKVVKKFPFAERNTWLTADAEGEQAIPIYDVGMSTSASSVMSKANPSSVRSIRRRNYAVWTQAVAAIAANPGSREESSIRPLLPKLPPGCCPLYFPVVVNNPASVKQFLQQHDIECFNWWQHKHEAVNWERYPVAAQLKRCVVALPVHQKLTEAQILRAAKCLEQSLVPA